VMLLRQMHAAALLLLVAETDAQRLLSLNR
jgi:hypothetical protein